MGYLLLNERKGVHMSNVDNVNVINHAKQVISKHVDIVVEMDKMGDDVRLDEIGVNSINFIRMIIELETYYDIQFDIDMLGVSNFELVGNFVKYVAKLVEEKV